VTSSTENVKLGVCSVTFGGVDLGYTKGGVEVAVATETHQVMIDQFGNTPVNELIMGRTCKATVPLAETTLENLVRIMPGSSLVDVGGVAATGSVTFATAVPAANDSVTVNGVVFTFKASPTGPLDVAPGAAVTDAATNFVAAFNAAINSGVHPELSALSATNAAGVVTITAVDEGTWANSVTLAKSGTNITVSGTKLTGGVDATKKKVVVTSAVSTSLLALAKRLVLHPVALPETDRSEDFIMPICNTAGAMTFAYKIDTERVFNVEFNAYPDPNTKVLFVYGDESAE
jgi:hypothetical protein